eukprot:CAMPEP_0114583962 /NCGR_PEP_ID=MMETSP0125-20121206/7642_1 /TAXON_ID=485358 ORGANISM="Aristerostoma sp., Strain ATCC 50986" /NCGR_SAMPLE_ID=MMETSP0125 /ASSEMBLY_ACC=CAM_ASM_000245 /LENGTH=66 /DNA_ID=CAMNT_0001777837 /DNA_START=446 /DNA_END=646 /DNA_ORIENTATION=+
MLSGTDEIEEEKQIENDRKNIKHRLDMLKQDTTPVAASGKRTPGGAANGRKTPGGVANGRRTPGGF